MVTKSAKPHNDYIIERGDGFSNPPCLMSVKALGFKRFRGFLLPKIQDFCKSEKPHN